MINKQKKQVEKVAKKETTVNRSIWLKDLSKLRLELADVTKCLNEVIRSLRIDEKVIESLEIESRDGNIGVWSVEQAKEYLELIMAHVSLGRRQIIRNGQRVVYMSKE